MADEKSADKLMKEAEKYLKPALLSGRFKPDWDEAYPLFEKAAVQYRVAGCSEKAIEAYEKAAHANVRGHGTAWHAAKSLEGAAQICKDQQDSRRSADFAKQAADHYVDAGKAASGAECLARAARWLEGPAASTSGRLYKDALALYAKDPLAAMAHDLVQRGVGIQLQQGKADDAIDMLMQWASICADTNSGTSLCRAYLGVIVLHLHKGDAPTAWASYQDFLDVEEFSNSAEAMSAENLLDGYKSGDAAMIKQRLGQGRCWNNLDAAVARVAKALPGEDADLSRMAALFRNKMADGDDAADSSPEDENGELDLT